MNPIANRLLNFALLGFLLLNPACKPVENVEILRGTWEYCYGYHPADVSDSCPDGWQKIEILPELDTYPQFKNYLGWLTLRYKLGPQIDQLLEQKKTLTFDSGRINGDRAEFYFNNQKIGTLGQEMPFIPSAGHTMLVDLDYRLNRPGNNHLTVIFLGGKNYSFRLLDPGNDQAHSMKIGLPNSVYQIKFNNELISVSLIAISLSVCIILIFIGWQRKGESYYWHFALFCFFLSAHWLLRSMIREQVFSDHPIYRNRIEVLLIFLQPSQFIFFLSHFFYRKRDKVGFYYLIYSLLLFLVILIIPYQRQYDEVFKFWLLTTLPILIYVLFLIFQAWKKSIFGSGKIGIGAIVAVLAAANDILSQLQLIDTPQVLRFAMVAIAIGYTVVITEDFRRTQKNAILFGGLLDYLPDSIFVLDGMRIVYANQSCQSLLSTREKQISVGWDDIRNLIPERNNETIYEKFFIENTGIIPSSQVYINLHDKQIFASLTVIPFHLENRLYRQIILNDETEQHNTKDALEISELRFHSVSQSIYDAIIATDPHGNIFFWNPAAERMFGWTTYEALGQPFTLIIPPSFREAHSSGFAWTRDSMQMNNLNGIKESIGLHKDGFEFPMELTISQWQHANQIYIATVIRDISARKRLERLRADTERIVQHDLKSPLSAILGFSELLQEEYESQENLEALSIINKSATDMIRMIDNSLDIFKMGEGTYHLNPHDFDFAQTVRELGLEFNRIAQNKNLGIKIQYADRALTDNDQIPWRGEASHIKNMLANLLKNAIEASEPGSQITISINLMDELAQLAIHNPGVIPVEIQQNLFQPYTTYGKLKGTGLGVYSAALIARTHGGKIEFQSDLQTGTTFYISLPRSSVRNPHQAVNEV